MINITDKTKCSGCSACRAACPAGCIEMRTDEEGFIYPFVDGEKCVSCGVCSSVCPIENGFTESNKKSVCAFVVQNMDKKVLKESTSGGAFTAIATAVIKAGGVVYGASIDENLNVFHKKATAIEELSCFRNSKYLQSEITREIYAEIKFYLTDGKLVCFSGTPCQIAGLKSYLHTDYENLFTVDVVCRAVPSKLVFEKYLEYMHNAIGVNFKSVRFRDKRFGYRFSTMALVDERGKIKYSRGIESDPWLRAFFSNICDRPSCHECVFRTKNRNSDITIWDCFHAENYTDKISPYSGASCVYIHTDKGKAFFDDAAADMICAETAAERLVCGCREYFLSVPPNARRREFFDDANGMDGERLFKKYFPLSLKFKIKHIARRILNKTPFYGKFKKLYKRNKR